MNSIYFVSQVITLIRKKEKFKNHSVWVDWNEIIKEIFRDKINQSELKLLVYSGEAEYFKLGALENLNHHFLEYNDRDRKEIVELLSLFHQLLKNEKDVIFESRINNLLNEIKIHLKTDEIETIDLLVEEWINKKIEDKFFYKIKLPATLKIVLLDFFLRWISLWTFGNRKIWDFIEDSPFGQYGIDLSMIHILNQFLFIPIIILSIAYVRNSKIEKRTNQIFEDLGEFKIKISHIHNPWNYLISFIFFIVGILISVISFGVSPKDFIVFIPIISIMLSSYLIILLSFFSKNYPSIPSIMLELTKIDINQVKTNLNQNENDEEIIELDVNLKSATDKMEAYVLEAALFGALAFSGFLQIISSSNVSIETLAEFSQNIFQIFEGLVTFSFNELLSPIQSILNKDGILSLMAFLTLFCAVFFLAVIASRLRFNDLSDSVNKSLQLSKIYNEKEENLIQSNQGNLTEHSNVLTKIIRRYLISGNLTMEQTIPIMQFMRFFRTLGIITFFIIVVSGGLFVSVQLSLILAFIMFLSFIFFKFKLLVKYFKSLSNQIGSYYYRIEKKILFVGLFLLFICLISRSVSIESQFSILLTYFSFTVMILHFLFTLFIPERIKSDEFIESLFITRNRSIIIFKKISKIGLAILFLGMLFKIMQIRFAGLILILGICLFSLNLILSKKTYSNYYLTLLFRISFSIPIFFAIYFFLTQLVLKALLILTFTALLTCILLIVFYRKKILRSTIITTITISSFALLMNFSFFQFAFFHFSFNLKGYQNEMEANYVAYKLIRRENGQYLYAKTDKEKDSLKYYMKKMDRIIERNGISPSEIDYYCSIIGEYQKDTSIIKHAIKWSNWVLSKNDYYANYQTALYLMFEIGDYKGCINLLNKMEKRNIEIPEKELKQELTFLKAECLTELKKYSEALNIINSLEKNQLEEDFQNELNFLKARCLLEIKQYDHAIKIINILEKNQLDEDYLYGINFLKAKYLTGNKQYLKALEIIKILEKTNLNDNAVFKKELNYLKQICLQNLPASN